MTIRHDLPTPSIGFRMPIAEIEMSSAKRLNRRSIVGIDIGLSGVKVVELLRDNRGHQWLNRVYRQFERPLSSDRADVEEICATLAEELPRTDHSYRRSAVVTLPDAWCFTGPVRMEGDGDAKQRVESELGSDAESCSWDLPEAFGQRYQMVHGVNGRMSESIARIVNRTGHRCVKVAARPLALFNAVRLQGNAKAIVDLGWQSCLFVVCTEDGPGLVRCLPECGLSDLVVTASKQLGCSEETVVRLLRQWKTTPASGVDSRRASDELSGIVEPHFEKVGHEISQSMDYGKRIGCVAVDGPMILCGGGAALYPVPDLIERFTNEQTIVWHWSSSRQFTDTQWSPPDCLFAVALASALGGER